MHRPAGLVGPLGWDTLHRVTSWVGIAPTRFTSCQGPRPLRLIPEPLRHSVVSQRIARRTRPGDHSPGLSSKLYVRLSHSYSFPADGPCHGTPRASVAWPDPPDRLQAARRSGLGNSVRRCQDVRPALTTLPSPVCPGGCHLRATLPSVRSWALSAYPPALPGAFACGPIPPPAPSA
jgi:hypothetical protein